MNNRILVKTSLPDTPYAEVIYGIENLVISFGNFVELDLAHWEFIAGSREKLPYAHHPELRGIFDGWGWNVAELMNLIDHHDLPDFGEDQA